MKKSILALGAIAALGSSLLLFNNNREEVLLDNEYLANNKSIAIYVKQEDGNYEKTNTIPTSGYMLNSERSVCSNNAKPSWNISTNSLKISNLSSNNTSCYLYFETSTEVVNTVLGNITVNKYQPDFSQVATGDEGIFKANDNDGISYYWRGAATTNYLKFGGYCWRIVRINGDGTMRLIYDGATCHANGEVTEDSIAAANTAYNSNYNRSENVGWTYTEGLQRPSSTTTGTDAPIKTALESWYTTNITNKGYDAQVATEKFCNDRNVQSGYTWASQSSSTFNYAASTRIWIDYAPTLSCATLDTYSLKVGLITADEVMYAGGKNANNTSYYLYNGQNYWTMSPYYWYGPSSWANVFVVNSSGNLGNDGDAGLHHTFGVRPVINLASSTTFTTGGTGTKDNPYVVEGA